MKCIPRFAPGLFFILTIIGVHADPAVKQVASGAYHTAVVKSDGTLWTFGENGSAQLGDGTFVSTNQPQQIGADVVGVAHQFRHSARYE